MERREILQRLGTGGMLAFIAAGVAAKIANPPRVEVPEKSIEALRDLVRIQSAEGNYDYDPYMQGLANGLIMALSLFEDKDPAFLKAPTVWKGNNEPTGTPAGAVERLSRAFRWDPDYAQGWHANIACAAMDEGLDPAAANRAASRFMKAAFGVDTA